MDAPIDFLIPISFVRLAINEDNAKRPRHATPKAKQVNQTMIVASCVLPIIFFIQEFESKHTITVNFFPFLLNRFYRGTLIFAERPSHSDKML